MHHGCPVDSCFLLRYLDDRRGGGDLLLEPRQQGGMKNEDGMKTKDVVFHNVSLMEGRLCVCAGDIKPSVLPLSISVKRAG